MVYGLSNGHVTDDVTWPWKFELVTPICLWCRISKTAGFRDSVPKDHQSAILATAWLLVLFPLITIQNAPIFVNTITGTLQRIITIFAVPKSMTPPVEADRKWILLFRQWNKNSRKINFLFRPKNKNEKTRHFRPKTKKIFHNEVSRTACLKQPAVL